MSSEVEDDAVHDGLDETSYLRVNVRKEMQALPALSHEAVRECVQETSVNGEKAHILGFSGQKAEHCLRGPSPPTDLQSPCGPGRRSLGLSTETGKLTAVRTASGTPLEDLSCQLQTPEDAGVSRVPGTPETGAESRR